MIVEANAQFYVVDLDEPVTANDWSGMNRRLAGHVLLSKVRIASHHSELVKDHIRRVE